MFIWKIVLRFIRKSILKKANFDIDKLDVLKYAKNCYSPWKFFYPNNDDFVDPSHSKKLYQVYSGDKSITEFEGDHNSQRPNFFYDSAAIFFHNVLMCDSIEIKENSPRLPGIESDETPIDKLPEFDSTGFKLITEVVHKPENEGIFKLDERINYIMERNRREEIKQQYSNEDKETRDAVLRSIETYTEERDKDETIIETLNKMGLLRQFSARDDISLDSANLLKEIEANESKILDQSTDEIKALREVLTSRLVDTSSESKSTF